MLRFKVGELARVVGAYPSWGANGCVVEIIEVGPWKAGDFVLGGFILREADYAVLFKGLLTFANDRNLLKIGDPDQQVTQEVGEEITA